MHKAKKSTNILIISITLSSKKESWFVKFPKISINKFSLIFSIKIKIKILHKPKVSF